MTDNPTPEAAPEQDAPDPETVPTEASQPRKTRRQLLEREGEVAADFLETLLDIADLDGDIDLDIDGDRAAVAVVDSDEGRVPRRLVGQDGKVLEALQELTRLAVQSATGDRSRLMLDVAGHRAARRAELVEVAGRAVASVKESGEAVELEPMSAFERKVVHDEVLAAGLVSDSSGTEPRRFVVVHPADEGDDAEADADAEAQSDTGAVAGAIAADATADEDSSTGV
ncbi:Jag family protein [Janibacter sp. Soil728]|uniref:Jag family protein n=1 Tax=Janibacter sp. Soil728 TaxID=1736393 RepID=UPI0009E918C7|nr:R3H domain-containing nucleic acid-binding protein [Janibacter sp. Soil728]